MEKGVFMTCISAINKNTFIIYLMQKNNLLTVSTTNDHQTERYSTMSKFSMTSQQIKLYQSGMYFPEKVIFKAELGKKMNQYCEQSCMVKLTTQAFGHIPISSITKIKYYRTNQQKKLTLKIISTSEQAFFQVSKERAVEIFSFICWSKLMTMNLFSNIEEKYQKYLKGELYKKGEVFGSWQKRFVTISDKRGLQSSKSEQGSTSLHIENTSEIWTRFETIQQQKYLVIKLWYGLIKSQFAIPIENANQWIQAFCSLLSDKQ